jgi:hypothetical protein
LFKDFSLLTTFASGPVGIEHSCAWSYVCAGGFGFGKRPEGTGLARLAIEHCKVIEKREGATSRRDVVFIKS